MADSIGYVPAAKVFDLVKAIVATQRDYGDRATRRHARMKYLLHDWGVEKFKAKVEEYLGQKLEAAKSLPEFQYLDFLGWHDQGDGKLFLGISVQNGRVKDAGKFRLKTALKEIVATYQLSMLLTPHQNLILTDIDPAHKSEIQQILERYGVKSESEIDPLERLAMACPALPTCGLAITESERAIPGVVLRVRKLLNRLGLKSEEFVIRMTGCPNGCARPYLAELGFVGITPETYQIWLGGSPAQTRMARTFQEKLPIDQLEVFLEPLLVYFKQSRLTGERFGDFCDRVGFPALQEFAANYTPRPVAKERRRLDVHGDVYLQIKQLADAQGKSLTQMATEALAAYLNSLSQ
jgi:sulfite reductase (ferredoxin)